jgi:proline dehydrogenase
LTREQVRFQPAIDSLVLELQRTYNAKSVSDKPIVYNTYQCYLKEDVPDRLAVDVERSGALTITLEPAGAWRV